MSRNRQIEQHAATRVEIKATARKLMADQGSAALSIRAIGREMQLTAPALYYYYPSREALITDLILDAFNALADALEAVRDAHAGQTAGRRLMHICLAYREWALAHPVDFALIYGTPIPGYQAPEDTTVPAATRAYVIIARLLDEALRTGELVPWAGRQELPGELRAALLAQTAPLEAAGVHLSLAAHYLTAVGWSRIHGVIMLELFEHIQPVVGDVAVFYRLQLEEMFGMSAQPSAFSNQQ
jgi:AcrR family transcriptional regulator